LRQADTDPTSETSPLEGVRVLDFADGALGAVGRALAELGADVVRVEPPGGAAERREGPSVGGMSLAFAAANLGKRAIELDLSRSADIQQLDRLAASADILIESTTPGSAAAAALDWRGLRDRHPGLVILSMPSFGEGAFAEWRASDAVLHALSSELARSGSPGREPLLPPGEIALQCAAAQGAYAVLIAYLRRLSTGEGGRIELSLLEAVTQSLDPGYGIGGTATAGVPASQLPPGRPDVAQYYPIIRCADGYVRLSILAARQWQGMFEWMGRPAEFADPAFNLNKNRFASSTLLPAMAAFLAPMTRAEIEKEGERRLIPASGVFGLAETLASEQITTCEALRSFEVAPRVSAAFLNGLCEIDGCRAGPRRGPPLAPTEAASIEADWSDPRAAGEPEAEADPSRPLKGIRVLDLGVIVVGSECGRLLADYGAEVIKIENSAFPDGTRSAAPPLSPGFAAGHRNKLGLGLNLRDPRGRALLLQMAAKSDVVLSNFKAGTLASLGLAPELLLQHNPRLIVVESSAFGANGPWNKRMGYGPLVRALAGLTMRWRYPDRSDSFCDAMTAYPDNVSSRVAITAVLALLARRHRTGRGGAIGSSQMEIMLAHMGGEVPSADLRRQGIEVGGGPVLDAPYGVYRCAGEDEWCVVSIHGDAEWRALCSAIERPDLAADQTLATSAGRDAQRDTIDAAVAAWTARRTPDETMRRLQSAGVPAGAMLRVSELPQFGFFHEREFFQLLAQPQHAAPVVVDNAPLRSEGIARPPLRPAPLLGEQTRPVIREVLGLSDEEIDALLDQKVLETS
jgi:crotonobetainyl-CoA:carnitine CoA-transferase CaiB-like acyl-CoA transferase